ncbi:transglycosylase SLT domain-containing protein [Castellaniella sp.]|uniref:lytic transglycosylase domain-containing protein n=1 Tax=Castellaniella sp. TaxID=1955812 RepID=UPI003C77101F
MVAGFSDRLQHGARAVVSPVSEFIHVSAIYLGLAVLTTLALSLVLPSMRQQSRQLHEVVLAMFQADGGSYSAPDSDEIWSPMASSDVADATDNTSSPAAGETAAEQPGDNPPAAAQPPVAQAGVPGFMQAVSASIHDRSVPGATASQVHSLRSYLARKYRISPSVAGALVRIVFPVARDLKLDPQLMLAVIAIESRYNPFVESSVGAQGLMQVMGTVHRDKLRQYGGQPAIFNPVVNIRVGGQILADCIRRRGSVQSGLACYVGASGPSDGGYGAKVLAERRRIALASGIPLGK